MVRRYLCAFKAFVIAVATFMASGGLSPVSANQSDNPAAAQPVPVTHIVKYGRREFRSSGGELYICKGKYLSYQNYKCEHKSGVNPLTAERTLAQDIKEKYGQSAVILSAREMHPPGSERRLEVQVGVTMNGPAGQYDNIELLYQFPSGYWAQANGKYFVCQSDEVEIISEQYACIAPRSGIDWLIGKKIFTQPISVLDHIQQKNGFAVEIGNMHVDSNKSLRVTYRKADKYDDAIKDYKAPALIGDNRPKWLESIGLAEYADALVIFVTLVTIGVFFYAIKTESLLAVGAGTGIQIGGWLTLSANVFFAALALVPLCYIGYKSEERETQSRDAIDYEARRRERAQRERQRAQLGNVDALREITAPVQINEVAEPELPIAEPGSKPVRKIILD